MKWLLVLCLSAILHINTFGQELNVRVQVLAPNVSNISRKNLDALQTAARDFLNNNKWTNETYLPQERITCNIVLTLTNWDGNSGYQAEAQIQSSRPVFGSSYYTTLLNINDKDFDFSYTQGQALDFSEQNFISNLSSLLAYYAYTIIGLDKDSFSKLGGSSYFLKAQNTLNIAQTFGNKGWKAADGLRNRYWLNENLLNNSFRGLRIFSYDYHLNGLDLLQNHPLNAAKKIYELLPQLQQMDKQKTGAVFPNLFFSSKADEMVNILLLADLQDRLQAFNILSEMDPANIGKYEKLKK